MIPSFAWLATSLALPALAEEPVFSVDALFVSRFEATGTAPSAASALRDALDVALGEEFVVIPRTDVPAFEDYSAETYLASCPKRQVYGCAYVVAERAEADWAVAGTIVPGEGGAWDITVGYVHVADGRVVYSFGALVEQADFPSFAKGVVEVTRKVVREGREERDTRVSGDSRPSNPYALDDIELSVAMAGIQQEVAVLERTVSEAPLERPKLTKDDLAQYEGRDDGTPWERYDMSEAEYLRFRNSGIALNEWRARRRGRSMRAQASLGVGAGGGPWGIRFDGRWALDAQTLDLVEIDQLQEVQSGGGALTELEVGFGVLPQVDVNFVFGVRGAPYEYRFHAQVENSNDPVADASTAYVQTTQVGARVRYAPFPVQRIRPTAMVGVFSWRGPRIGQVAELPTPIVDLDGPRRGVFELGPGAEFDIGKYVQVFGTTALQFAWGGNPQVRFHEGEIGLIEVAEFEPTAPVGFQFTAGVRVRSPHLVRQRVEREFEEE